MITGTLRRAGLSPFGRRLDAWYYLSPGAGAARRLDMAKAAGLRTVLLGGAGGLGNAWMPNRLTQAHAAPGEKSVPYVKPHDLLQYLPTVHAHLSVRKTKRLADYRIERGWILQTRSGRNLGLNVLVDEDLTSYVVSDDLIRIQIDDERMRFYATAFLRSRTGHGLLRRDKSGSVIDHLNPNQVESIEIPLAPSNVVDAVAKLIQRSFEQRESSRRALREALQSYEAQLPSVRRDRPLTAGWSVRSNALTLRLDAASYDPLERAVARELQAMGGQRLDTVALPLKPPGRYKTNYVGPDHGIPFLSGTQILQYVFPKPQFMSPRTFKRVDDYRVHQGWTIYMADGRSEMNLGVPAMVTSARENYAASGHVGRLVPKVGTNQGWLLLAAKTWHFGVQIKARASGSVVDSTFPADAASIILPPPLDVDGGAVMAAWEGFAEAQQLEADAVGLLDGALAEISGVSDEELEPEPELSDTSVQGGEVEEEPEG